MPRTSTARTRATERDSDKRQRILRAAWRRIRHYGYAKTRVDEIAADAGIAKGTAYLYFRSKADIMVTLAEETNRRILDELTAIAGDDGPADERLREVMLHRVRAIADLVYRYPHGDEFFRPLKSEIVRRVHGYVLRQGELAAGLIREGNRAGRLAVDDPDATGRFLAELFERFTPPYDGASSPDEVTAFAGRTFDLLLTGMRAPAAPARPGGGEP